MASHDDDTDAMSLAEQAMRVGAPDQLFRAQVEMARWGVASIPVGLTIPGVNQQVSALMTALDNVFDDRASGVEAQRGFEAWVAVIDVDWATREAFESLNRSLERIFQPEAWSLPPDGTDLPETVSEIIRTAGLWAWDELLYEASEFGDPGGKNAAQEVVRDNVEAEANRALCAILRRLVAGL